MKVDVLMGLWWWWAASNYADVPSEVATEHVLQYYTAGSVIVLVNLEEMAQAALDNPASGVICDWMFQDEWRPAVSINLLSRATDFVRLSHGHKPGLWPLLACTPALKVASVDCLRHEARLHILPMVMWVLKAGWKLTCEWLMQPFEIHIRNGNC